MVEGFGVVGLWLLVGGCKVFGYGFMVVGCGFRLDGMGETYNPKPKTMNPSWDRPKTQNQEPLTNSALSTPPST